MMKQLREWLARRAKRRAYKRDRRWLMANRIMARPDKSTKREAFQGW